MRLDQWTTISSRASDRETKSGCVRRRMRWAKMKTSLFRLWKSPSENPHFQNACACEEPDPVVCSQLSHPDMLRFAASSTQWPLL
eukprot:6195789-Pleurochrysis_carterae.AAC.1